MAVFKQMEESMLNDILMSCENSARNCAFVQIPIDMLSRARDLHFSGGLYVFILFDLESWGLSQPVAEEPGYGMEIEQTKQAQLHGTLPTEGEGMDHTQM